MAGRAELHKWDSQRSARSSESGTCVRCKSPIALGYTGKFVCASCRAKKGRRSPAINDVYPSASRVNRVRKIPFTTMAEAFIEDAKFFEVSVVIAINEVGVTDYYATGSAKECEEMLLGLLEKLKNRKRDVTS